MFCVAINWCHAVAVFIWIFSIIRWSNCYRIIFFLIKVCNIHVLGCSVQVISKSSFFFVSTGWSISQVVFFAVIVSVRIWNNLNWLFPLIVCPIQQAGTLLTLVLIIVQRLCRTNTKLTIILNNLWTDSKAHTITLMNISILIYHILSQNRISCLIIISWSPILRLEINLVNWLPSNWPFSYLRRIIRLTKTNSINWMNLINIGLIWKILLWTLKVLRNIVQIL